MKDWYFYQERGKTVGPVSLEDLKVRIREGKLRLFDLVYKDGENIWEIAVERPELKEELQAVASDVKGRPWVCLQRKEGAESEFVTTGPFSAEEIRESLQSGKVSYSDYIWREGLKEWKRIGSVEDFNSKARRKRNSPAKESPEELLKAVVQIRRPKVSRPVEDTPPEASTPDLTKGLAQSQTEVMASGGPPPLVERRKQPRPAQARLQPKAKLPKRYRLRFLKFNSESRWIDLGLLVFLLLAIGQAAFWAAHRIQDSAGRKDLIPETDARFEMPAEIKSEPEKERPHPSIPSKAPTELLLAIQESVNGPARIEVRTDGSPDYPVLVQVIGLPGQLIDAPSFYRFYQMNPPGDISKPLDLNGLKLPAGRFILRAETGKLRKEKQINLGVTDSAYKTAISRARKAHAYAIWRDRLNLIKVSRLLEERLSSALKSKQKLSVKGLESLTEMKRSNGENYVIFEDWWDLKEVFEAARVSPSLTALEQVRQFRERFSSFSIWSYK